MSDTDDGVIDHALVLSTFYPYGCVFYWEPSDTGRMLPVNALNNWQRFKTRGFQAVCDICSKREQGCELANS